MKKKLPKVLQKFDSKQAHMGMAVEKEHEDVTHGDTDMTAKIAAAHLKEDPKYYTKLKQLEESVSDLDREYLKAVKRGDMETAQRMVDIKSLDRMILKTENIRQFLDRHDIKINGRFITLYHGTPKKQKMINNVLHKNSYLAKNPEKAAFFAARDRDLDPEKDITVHTILVHPSELEYVGHYMTNSDIPLDRKPSDLVNPVTYDDQGNVIPLSKRFDEQSSDIRESISGFPKFDSTVNQILTEISCWKGYKKVGTKKKNGKTVNNCVKESSDPSIWTDSDIKYLTSYNQNRKFPTEQEARIELYRQLERWDNDTSSTLFGKKGETYNKIRANTAPVFKIGNYFKLGKRTVNRKKQWEDIDIIRPSIHPLLEIGIINPFDGYNVEGMKWIKLKEINPVEDHALTKSGSSYIEKLASSIKDNARFVAIIIDEHYNILDGHHRFYVIKNIFKWSRIPVLLINTDISNYT